MWSAGRTQDSGGHLLTLVCTVLCLACKGWHDSPASRLSSSSSVSAMGSSLSEVAFARAWGWRLRLLGLLAACACSGWLVEGCRGSAWPDGGCWGRVVPWCAPEGAAAAACAAVPDAILTTGFANSTKQQRRHAHGHRQRARTETVSAGRDLARCLDPPVQSTSQPLAKAPWLHSGRL